jgi:lactoylglutathione lyase
MKIEHIAIWTKDLEIMKNFYCSFFNGRAGEKYTNPAKHFQSYFITFASGARLEIMQKPEIPENLNSADLQYIGINHLAFAVGDRGKVNKMTEMFRKEGYKVVSEPRVTGDGYYESVIFDPEQNRIELVSEQ